MSGYKPRQSPYRKDYENEFSDNNSQYNIGGDVKVMKEAEKEQMQSLNNNLVNYIEKVHDLEEMVINLSAENAHLKNQCNKDEVQVDLAGIYDDELNRLRTKVEQLKAANIAVAIDRDNKAHDLNETDNKYKEQNSKLEGFEKEINFLREDIDDATIERTKLESKIENLKEQLALEQKVHVGEMENLRDQIKPNDVPLTYCEFNQNSMLPDLSEAISNARQEYEAFNAKSLEDLDNFYKKKIDNLYVQVSNLKKENRELRQENSDKRREIHRLEVELKTLQQSNITMMKTIEGLEERLREQNIAKEEELEVMRAQLEDTKQDLGIYLKQYQELNVLKLSLDQEISIYRKLITGETDRIAEVDTNIEKFSNNPSNERKPNNPYQLESRPEPSFKSNDKVDKPEKNSLIQQMMKFDSPQNDGTENQYPKKINLAIKGGTIKPINPFNPEKDAEIIRDAIKGFGTDEEAVIDILTKRTKSQRAQIDVQYKAKYDKNLIEAFDDESSISSEFFNTIRFLMWEDNDLDAHAIRKAIKGFGNDEVILISILSTKSNHEINNIKKKYSELFERDLISDIREEGLEFEDYLVELLQGQRDPSYITVNTEEAESDAKKLFDLQVKNWNPSNRTFINIFTKRSFQHLSYIFKQWWGKLTNDDLIKSIERNCDKSLRRGMKTIVRFSTLITPQYFAAQAYDALTADDFEDREIIYILTTRSEIDLLDIKDEYNSMYNKSIMDEIEEVASSKFKKILLSILG